MYTHNMTPPGNSAQQDTYESPSLCLGPRFRKRRRSSAFTDTSSTFHCFPSHHLAASLSDPDAPLDLLTVKEELLGFSKTPVIADVAHCYPSPPPTGSQQKRSVPLPCLVKSVIPSTAFEQHPRSLLEMTNFAPFTPLSPPPTTHTATLDLPSTDVPMSCDSDDASHLSTDQHHLESGDELRHGHSSQLLSPLSPEWASESSMPDTASPSNRHQSILLSHPAGVTDSFPPDLLYSLPGSGVSHICFWPPWSESQLGGHKQSDDDASRPFLSLLDIPNAASWPPSIEVEEEMDIDNPFIQHDEDMNPLIDDEQPTDSWPSASTTSVPDLEEDLFDSPPSPFIRDLDELPPDEPPSPMLRSFASLPDFAMDEGPDDHHVICSPPGSILSLPGAETDDELIPVELSLSTYEELSSSVFASPNYSKSSLLLLDDITDFPPPRSPSPDNLDIDPSLLEEIPDLRRLCDLRKKYQASEKSLRQLEAQYLEDGQVHARAHVRRERKRHKDRSKELTALLKLKIGEHVLVEPAPEDEVEIKVSTKKPIASMAQLVARMMLKRHENFRPLANKKAVMGPDSGYTPSSLSRSSSFAEESRDT